MISLRVPLEDWNLLVRNVLPAHSVGFLAALVVGLIVWILLRRASKRRWQAAMAIGAACYYFVPAFLLALGTWVFFQGVDWIVFGRGPVDVTATLVVGAVVGGVMWRVAYRRIVKPPISDVFT